MIIVLTGKKGCGKDTIANYICEKYGFVNHGFADPIKEIGKIIFGFTDEQLNGHLKEVNDTFWGIAPRDFFQKFGTDIAQFEFPKYFPGLFRDNDERAIWVRIFEFWYVKKLKENPKLKVVISDMRFKHEYEYLKKLDSYFIKINRNIENNKQNEKFSEHLSENELNNYEFNCEIKNNGSLEDLFLEIDKLIN